MKKIKLITADMKTTVSREKVAKVIKEVNAKDKKYTKADMISFAEHILLVNTGNSGEDIEPEFKDWLKDNK